MFAATYNGFTVPYFIAFEPKYQFTQGYDIINIIIDLIFIWDIFIRLRTTYMNEIIQQEILDPKLIAKRYFKKQFFIDLLTATPVDYFAYWASGIDAQVLIYLGATRLLRIWKIPDIASVVNLPDFLKNFIRVINLIFALSLYISWSAWCWFLIISTRNDWMPPLDFVWVKTEFYQESQFFKYWTWVYYVVNIQIGNDIGPRGAFQMFYLSVVLMISAFINAIIFGNIAVILQIITKDTTILNEKIDVATSAMSKLTISDSVKSKIKEYLKITFNSYGQQKDMEEFIQMLSPSLKLEITRQVFDDCIIENKVFGKNIDVLEFILEEIVIAQFVPEDIIWRQGDEGLSIFLISNGSCSVHVFDQFNNDSQWNILTKVFVLLKIFPLNLIF